MDHLIGRINADIEVEFEYFYRELKSGKYGSRYSEQPSYGTLKALIDSVNILRKNIGWDSITIKEKVLDREELN